MDLRANAEEARILNNWVIKIFPKFIGALKVGNGESKSPEVWEPPSLQVFKLNFDGASKGNLGSTTLGGAFRNSRGRIIGLYCNFIGANTNNVVDLKALMAELHMAVNNFWLPVIIEGDSQIILQIASKLLHGKPIDKVADN